MNYADHSSPAIGDDGIYVSYNCTNVYKFWPLTGALAWTHMGNCLSGGGNDPAYYDQRLYVRDNVNNIGTILDAHTGHMVGTFGNGTIPTFSGKVLIQTVAGQLQATDAATGGIVWTFAGDGTLSSAPILVNGYAYVGSTSGNLYAVDPATGKPVWDTAVGAPINPPGQLENSAMNGLGAGEGWLIVPASTKVVAYQ